MRPVIHRLFNTRRLVLRHLGYYDQYSHFRTSLLGLCITLNCQGSICRTNNRDSVIILLTGVSSQTSKSGSCVTHSVKGDTVCCARVSGCRVSLDCLEYSTGKNGLQVFFMILWQFVGMHKNRVHFLCILTNAVGCGCRGCVSCRI